MNARDSASTCGRSASLRLAYPSARKNDIARDELLAATIRAGIEDLGDHPRALRDFLDGLGDVEPERGDWIFETACAWSPELAEGLLGPVDEHDPVALAAEIHAAAAADGEAARAGLTLGRTRLVEGGLADAPSTGIEANDPDQRAIADMLVKVAGLLGLDATTLVLDLSPDAAATARRAGSVAIALEGRIHLDGARFDPHSPAGREVLAHEMVHLAQWRLGRDAAAATPVPRALAEAEAAHIGRCFVSGHTLSRPIVPLHGAAPAAFSPGAVVMGALATMAGDLRGRFAESLVGQLEGTLGAPLVPGLRQWGAGALDASDDKGAAAASPAPAPAEGSAPAATKEVPQDEATLAKTGDDEIAEALGHAGADALVAGGKLTLFFIRAFFAVASKLGILPLAVDLTAGPFTLHVGGTGSFKEVELYGRLEIDWAQLLSWLSDLTGLGVGTQPAQGSGGADDKGGIHLFGGKKAKVDDKRDFHITFPWKDFLGGWKASIPPLDVAGYAGWDGGELSMQGLEMKGLRAGLPSLPSLGLQWSDEDGAPVDKVMVEIGKLSLGTENALEKLHLEPSPANLHFGEWVGLDGIALEGSYDEAKGAQFSAEVAAVWFKYGDVQAKAGGCELAYDPEVGPSASLESFDVDLAGWFEVHGEGGRVSPDGLDLARLRLPVPKNVQAVLDTLKSIQWTIIDKRGGEVRAGTGIPPLALVWEDLHIGFDGFDNVLPRLDPNPADSLVSIAIGDVLSLTNMSCAIEGVEAWAFDPDPPSPTFDFSVQHAALSLFGVTLQGAGGAVHVSLDDFGGALQLLQVSASPLPGLTLEAHVTGARVSPAGFAADTVGCGVSLASDALGALADTLGPFGEDPIGLTFDLVGLSFDATRGLGVDAFGLTSVVIDVSHLGRLEIPLDVVRDVLVNGFGSAFVTAFVAALIERFKAELGALVSQVVDLIYAAAEVAEEVVEAAWEIIVAWVPGLTETPPAMGPRDTALAQHLGRGALWPEVFAQIRSLDDGVGALEVFDRDLMDEARAFIAAGAIASGFDKLVALAQSEAHPSLSFWQAALAAAEVILAAPPPEAEAASASGDAAEVSAEGEPALIDPANHQSRDTFVRSQVKEIDATTALIDQLYPYFPASDLVIGGHLDDNEQFWKVNFHWEWMLWIIDEALELGPSEADAAELRDIQAALRTNPPLPASGYIPDRTMSLQDASPIEVILERWALMKTLKARLNVVWGRTDLAAKADARGRSPDSSDLFLAAAPVAKPGTSKHGTGKALDIKGDNAAIVKRAHDLGATLVFDEASHVHVEFMDGVDPT